MKTILCLFSVLLAGCTATRPPTFVRVIQETQPATDKPWSDGEFATYWMGRTTIGSDGSVLHEAHPVYRRENAGQPRLATPPELFLPTNTAASSTNAAFEQFELLRAEAARARELTLQLTRASEALAQQASGLKATAENTRHLQEQLRQLLQSSAVLSNRLLRLETQSPPATANPPIRSTNGW